MHSRHQPGIRRTLAEDDAKDFIATKPEIAGTPDFQRLIRIFTRRRISDHQVAVSLCGSSKWWRLDDGPSESPPSYSPNHGPNHGPDNDPNYCLDDALTKGGKHATQAMRICGHTTVVVNFVVSREDCSRYPCYTPVRDGCDYCTTLLPTFDFRLCWDMTLLSPSSGSLARF